MRLRDWWRRRRESKAQAKRLRRIERRLRKAEARINELDAQEDAAQLEMQLGKRTHERDRSRAELERLRAAVRAHRDSGDGRHPLVRDERLYAALDERGQDELHPDHMGVRRWPSEREYCHWCGRTHAGNCGPYIAAMKEGSAWPTPGLPVVDPMALVGWVVTAAGPSTLTLAGGECNPKRVVTLANPTVRIDSPQREGG